MSSTGLSSKTCLFCKPEFRVAQKIDETKNFFIITDGAPLGPGHILLIPKKHFSCYASLPESLNEEFIDLRTKIIDFLEKHYGRTILFEHGISGQTVFHAHLHFLPTEKKVFPYASKIYTVKEIKNFSALKNILKKDKGYLFFEEDGLSYVIKTKNPEPGFFHAYLLNKLLKVSGEFNERAKNAKTVSQTVKRLWKAIVV